MARVFFYLSYVSEKGRSESHVIGNGNIYFDGCFSDNGHRCGHQGGISLVDPGAIYRNGNRIRPYICRIALEAHFVFD